MTLTRKREERRERNLKPLPEYEGYAQKYATEDTLERRKKQGWEPTGRVSGVQGECIHMIMPREKKEEIRKEQAEKAKIDAVQESMEAFNQDAAEVGLNLNMGSMKKGKKK